MKNIKIIYLLFLSLACSESQEPQSSQIPNDGIKIGQQIWMRENLRVKTFRNGDLITESKSVDDWVKFYNEKKPAWTSLMWEKNNEQKFGLIYNYYALIDPRGITPKNWKIPTSSDFFELIEFNGGGNQGALKIMSNQFWQGTPGTNKSGFDARPGGEIWAGGTFVDINNETVSYWTNSQSTNGNPITISISSTRDEKFKFFDETSLQLVIYNKAGFYIRGIIE